MPKYVRSLHSQLNLPDQTNNLLFTNNKLKPLLNLQIYSNADTATFSDKSSNTKKTVVVQYKPQYGESKYTSSLYAGKMHKLLIK